MNEHVLPVAGAQPIVPGPCTPTTPCPPFTEIVCVDVAKVFDSCSQVECQEFCFPEDGADSGDVRRIVLGDPDDPRRVDLGLDQPILPTVVSCTVGAVTVGPITTALVPGQPLLQRVMGDICAPVTVTATLQDMTPSAKSNTNNTVTITVGPVCFHKDVLLYMPNPTTMFGKIEVVSFVCLGGRFTRVDGQLQLCVTIGLRAIVKSEGYVQLMVGAFGYCPVPPTCRELGTICEGFIAAPFPSVFPPEIFEVPPTGSI